MGNSCSWNYLGSWIHLDFHLLDVDLLLPPANAVHDGDQDEHRHLHDGSHGQTNPQAQLTAEIVGGVAQLNAALSKIRARRSVPCS